MIILMKHLLLVLGYIIIYSIASHNQISTPFYYYIGISIVYYLLLLVPKIHQIYIYNIVERIIPKSSYIPRVAFHYCLFSNSISSSSKETSVSSNSKSISSGSAVSISKLDSSMSGSTGKSSASS